MAPGVYRRSSRRIRTFSAEHCHHDCRGSAPQGQGPSPAGNHGHAGLSQYRFLQCPVYAPDKPVTPLQKGRQRRQGELRESAGGCCRAGAPPSPGMPERGAGSVGHRAQRRLVALRPAVTASARLSGGASGRSWRWKMLDGESIPPQFEPIGSTQLNDDLHLRKVESAEHRHLPVDGTRIPR